MSEQQQRERIEKRHATNIENLQRFGAPGSDAHQDRGQLLTWLRERDGQIASLQKELARFQRTDVGERVREMEQMHAAAAGNLPTEPDFVRELDQHRGELLAICRQQAAEIETMRAEYSRTKTFLQDKVIELEQRLRAYEDAPTDKHERGDFGMPRDARGHRSADTPFGFMCMDCSVPVTGADTDPPCPVGAPMGASDEAYRPGLPPRAIIDAVYRAGGYWERVEGVDIYLRYDSSLEVCAVRNGYGFVLANEIHLSQHRYRPHGRTWSEVEQEAAKALGAEDATAGRDPWRRDLCDAIGPMIDTTACMTAYAAAYDAAKGG